MSSKKLYVERRDDGDYAVKKENSDRALAVTETQKEAIDIARKLDPGHSPDVERVRDTKKGGRDKWRHA